MGNVTNIVGAAGEYLCGTELLRPVAPQGFMFEPILLGGKEPTYDYIVYLLDHNSDRTGAFFFLQVKTTEKPPRPGGAYSVEFTAKDVERAKAYKVPFYLCVVDKRVTRAERIFIMGVDSTRRKGISRLAPLYDLATDSVKIDLHDEVTRIWAAQRTPAFTKFT